METLLKGEAWDSFAQEIENGSDHFLHSKRAILHIMNRHLEEAKQRADEFRKKLREFRKGVRAVPTVQRDIMRDAILDRRDLESREIK